MDGRVRCPACEAENLAAYRFCGECGTRLPLAWPPCLHDTLAGQKFCGECGARLATVDSSTALPTGVAATGVPSALESATPTAYTPKHLAEKILKTRSAVEGERKLVTVMFSDVSGFTAMSERLDPEEVHAIMDRAFQVIIEAVHRYEGTINQFLGDGVMALFGAPIAHEDHPHRAIRAALAIQDGLTSLKREVRETHGVKFRVRMGINTGLVFVGAIGKDLRMDYTAVGDTTNLGARLLGLAGPGQILVSAQTHRLTEGFFKFDALGAFKVKGKVEPIQVYAALSELRGRSRLEVSRERGLTPLVGREREIGRLVEAYRRASTGAGAIALLTGDPGVGKSRLLFEFLHNLEGTSVLELTATCLSYGASIPYHPILELLRRYLGLAEGVPGDEVRALVEKRLVSLGIEGDEAITLVTHFLGISAPESFLVRFSGPQLKERTFDVLRATLLRAGEVQPVILVVENVHWIDSSSDEFLKHLAAGLPGHRLLLLLTSRLDHTVPWLSAPLAETIAVEGLDAGGVSRMTQTLLGVERVSAPLLDVLVDRGEGNPLYVEEILRQLRETGGIRVEDGEAQLSRPDVTVPTTIHDIIAARIDRLPDNVKHTLQVAAVLGRQVAIPLLARTLEGDVDPTAHLAELQASDFLFVSSREPELVYTFKHALTQDVAYSSLLERRRRTYHAAVGRGLEDLYTRRVDDVVELIAYHFGRGQVWDKALTYLRQSAAKARGKWALREALVSLEEALGALRHLPDTPEMQQQGIDVRLELRGSLYPLGEFEKMATYLRQAEAMAIAISDSGRLGLVSIQIAEYCRQTGRFAEARALAEQALAQGDKLKDLPLQLYAGHYLGLACHALGDYRRAADVLQAVVESPEAEAQWRTRAFGGAVIASWAGHQTITLAWLARCLAELGEFEEGLVAGRRAVALAEELGNPYSLVAACMGLGYSLLARGDLDAAGPVLERASRVAREANLTLLRPQAVRLLGGVYLQAGRIDEGLALVRSAAEEVEAKQLLMQQAAVLALLGEACLSAGHVDEASSAAQRALTLAREREQRGDAVAALRVLGDTAARDPLDIDKAEHHYGAAIALAGELEMRPLLARSHLGIGRLYLRAGDRDRAEDHLLTATRMFVAMDMPLWLQDAAATLAELGRLLIVASDHRGLYEYLSRALAPEGPIRVILDTPGGPRMDDEKRQQHLEGMLQSHGLSVLME
jgi:class 3 adenylate cyclase/tetratricopeptide (TPR) repeat protein